MSNVSVPLPEDMIRAVNDLIKRGVGFSKAEIIRRALQKYLEDQAVQLVLSANEEPSLDGDLDDLAAKL